MSMIHSSHQYHWVSYFISINWVCFDVQIWRYVRWTFMVIHWDLIGMYNEQIQIVSLKICFRHFSDICQVENYLSSIVLERPFSNYIITMICKTAYECHFNIWFIGPLNSSTKRKLIESIQNNVKNCFLIWRQKNI